MLLTTVILFAFSYLLFSFLFEQNNCGRFLKEDENGDWSYSAGDVVEYLRTGLHP